MTNSGLQQPRKIPTLVGLLLVAGAVALFSFAFERVSPFIRAAALVTPTEIELSNITNMSFTVSWLTAEPASGFIVVKGIDGKRTSGYDERDTAAINQTTAPLGKYTTHSVTVRNLQPTASYLVTLYSNGKRYSNIGSLQQVTTGPPLIEGGNGLEPAYGTVTTAGGKPAEGTLLYLTLEGGQKLSTLVKASGSWLIPLNLSRTSNLSSYLTGQDRITETIVAKNNTDEATAVTDTLNDNPVPEMVIGKTYDFRKIQAQDNGQPLAVGREPAVLGEDNTIQPGSVVAITKPVDGASLPTNLPLIQGTGVPGKQVVLVVGITNPISGTTTVGADGIWRFTPPKPLAPGKQSVTATSTDTKGKPIAKTHIFNVLKSGTQVLGEATPSATLTPTLEPTPTSTLAGEPLPESGSVLPTLFLLLLGLGLLSGGAVVLIK